MEFIIKETNGKSFTVVHDVVLTTSSCSCKHFELYGWLCRHVFVVLKDLGFNLIPSAYIMPRWTKQAISNPMFYVLDNIDAQCANVDDINRLLNKLWSDIHICIRLAEPCVDHLIEFSKIVEAYKIKLLSARTPGDATINGGAVDDMHIGKEHQFESFVGMAAPREVNIHPPTQSKNKGSGKRLKSAKEKGIEGSKKKRRTCKSCGEMTGHNARTCPKKHQTYMSNPTATQATSEATRG
ncbi:Protein FAR1-RELATED SEQUENCE 1 [Striga hermonthica]|uniref:Protein FAR1-RELATED SEQUENCE 1 n=1 Tax=Striga hermonthica TaxID=68872 RepID=A0A9N7NW54_STRHE|nr:Protein FAR1-RELATED SEQUENCE 1 [Striga hermonthica]